MPPAERPAIAVRQAQTAALPAFAEVHFAAVGQRAAGQHSAAVLGRDKYFCANAAIIHRMFPAAIRREISLGLKQIFIAYKVADAKYPPLHSESSRAC